MSFLSKDDIDLLRGLMDARTKRDEAAKAAKEAEAEYREVEADVHEKLSDGPVSRLNNVDLGDPWGKVSFQAKETNYGRIIDQDAALEHYENRAMVEQVSAPKFVMARINEEVRDCLEQGKQLPPGLDFYTKRFVSITRQKT